MIDTSREALIKRLRTETWSGFQSMAEQAANMLEADAQLHTEIADSRRYIWDMKTSHSKEMRELLLAGSPATAMNPTEVISIAYDTGCMPEQCTDASLLRFAQVITGRAQQVAVPALSPLTPEQAHEALTAAGVSTFYMTHAVTRKELWSTEGSTDVMSIVRALEAKHGIKGANP